MLYLFLRPQRMVQNLLNESHVSLGIAFYDLTSEVVQFFSFASSMQKKQKKTTTVLDVS